MIIDTISKRPQRSCGKFQQCDVCRILYVVQSLLTLLVPSSSGLAALSIPVMAPLCDLHGVNPEAAVTALQYANQPHKPDEPGSWYNSGRSCHLQDLF